MLSAVSNLALSSLKLMVWFVLLALIFIPLERFFSVNKQSILRDRWLQDVGFFFLNGLAPPLLLSVPISFLAMAIHRYSGFPFYTMMASLPMLHRLLLAMIVGEIGAYWGHRVSHTHPWLWRFHSVHHSAEQMDWLVNSRAHPLDMVFTRLSGLIPIYVLGLAQPSASRFDSVSLIYVFVGTFWAYLVHANVRWRFGVAEKWLATPAFHHWHHANVEVAKTYVNYAAIFPWIDKIFGSFYIPSRSWPKSYGLVDAASDDCQGGLNSSTS